MIKLKPCPNCHSDKVMTVTNYLSKPRCYEVMCLHCGLLGKTTLFKFRARIAWNRSVKKHETNT